MMPRSPMRAVLAAFAVLSCGPPSLPEIGTRAWVGDHLEIWTTPEAEICGGSFQYLDDHAEQLSRFGAARGVEARTERYRYYWMDEATFRETGLCVPSYAKGCLVRRRDIYTAALFTHELVHGEFPKATHSFLEEGLAEVLGDIPRLGETTEALVDVPSIFDETRGTRLALNRYRNAALFTRLLLDLFPDEALLAIQDTKRDMDYADVRQRLGMHGIDLDDVIDVYAGLERCWMEQVRIPLVECSIEPTPWIDGSTWDISGRLSCDDAETLGPSVWDNEMWVVRTVDIAAAGQYTLWLDGIDANTVGRFVACEPTPCESKKEHSLPFQVVVPGVPVWHSFAPGRYWFRVSRPLIEGPEPEFRLHIREGIHDPR